MDRKIALSFIVINAILALITYLNLEHNNSFYYYFIPFLLGNVSSFFSYLISHRTDLITKAVSDYFKWENESRIWILFDIIFFILTVLVILVFLFFILYYINTDYANLILNVVIGKQGLEPSTEQKFIFWAVTVLLSFSYGIFNKEERIKK